ncbi:WhiB family transcriptional regulator [Amycolatopsis sp. NPDC003676]
MHITTPIARLDVEQAEARIAWVAQARCKEVDPDQLFVRGAAQRKAATICRHCPVLMQCGADGRAREGSAGTA